MGITATNEVKLRPPQVQRMEERQTLACWHPHGLYTLSPLLFNSAGPRDRDAGSYGVFTMVANACFRLPVFREVLVLINARAADARIVDSLLTEGKSVFVCPGGIHEQLSTDPGQERVFFPPKLGFVRQAITHGVPLVPTYNFGENQLFDMPEWSKAFSWWMKNKFGAGVPLGIGRWGLPFVPKQQHLSIRVGELIEVGEAEEEPSDERVRDIFYRYCAELRILFDAHKDSDLPPEVAARGLELIWRGHDHEDLSHAGLIARLAPKSAPSDVTGPPPVASSMQRSRL